MPEIPYLSIEGKGEPAGKEFVKAVETLYPLAYGIKGLSKKEAKDFVVTKLEGLWWIESNKPALKVPRSEWQWKLLIRLPEFVSNQMVESAKTEVAKKKKNPLVNQISFEKIREGKCVQIMHVGPYATEAETITKIKNFIKDNGLMENGYHHEIYLSDPRKVAPEKMKTILRQPVRKK